MSISEKKSTTQNSQLAFDLASPPLELPGSFNNDYLLAVDSLSQAVRRCDVIVRKRLPDFLTFALGRRITKTMIDAWFTPSNQNRFPLDAFILTCYAIGEFSPLNKMLQAFEHGVIGPRDRALLELGRIAEQRRELQLLEDRARAIINKEVF